MGETTLTSQGPHSHSFGKNAKKEPHPLSPSLLLSASTNPSKKRKTSILLFPSLKRAQTIEVQGGRLKGEKARKSEDD
ncbi:unnamed protein product [Cuscuta epithymum]|uniref:Uncharacterized protein n=1 Tax=Cuscuta epithymum TaxID=186058 RepID=A0AAV0DJ89_9ASTE|nr:unnamed protein product [Cuscuta epithymum]